MDKRKRFLERHVSGGELEPKKPKLQDLIVEICLSTGIYQTSVIIDGLDEDKGQQPDRLVAAVDILQRVKKVKMLITSQPDPLIMIALHRCFTLPLDNRDLNVTLVLLSLRY